MSNTIRIGTRKSALALIQTQLIAYELNLSCPGIQTEIVTRDTLGDRILDKPLQDFGGKGAFVSEFELAMKEGAMDLAVHSAKDLPMELLPGLCIAAVSRREDPRDVLVTLKGKGLPSDGIIRIGTSSPRRQLEATEYHELLWPGSRGAECATLRGNVHTRLKRLEEGLFDGIILAAAGLKRLDLLEQEAYGFHFLEPEVFIPAGGQGLMAVEAARESEAAMLCRAIDNREGRLCFTLERAVLSYLDAGCHEPVGIHARIKGERMAVFGISKRDGRIKKVCLEGGITPEEISRLAVAAGKELG